MKKSSKKHGKKQNVRFLMIGGGVLLLFLVVGLAIFMLSKKENYHPYYEIDSRNDSIESTKVADSKAYAWVRVQGTNIDTPIVPLDKSLEEDIHANYLWTSSNYVEGENRKVIYGHNIRNVSSYPDKVNPDHFRFEQLVSFAYYDFAKENLYIQYNDGTGDALYKIYAITFNNEGDEYGQSYANDETLEYIQNVRKNSIYDYDVEVGKDDTLLSLVTCTRYFGAMEKTQFKVDARKLRKNEKIMKYNVETNSNYDIIK